MLTALRTLVLLRQGWWQMGELAEELGYSLRTTYRLVTTLKEVGLRIERRRRGQKVYFHLSLSPLLKLLRTPKRRAR